jgi:hypothetical protein
MRYPMRKDKKDKHKKAYTVILTKPETIFNEEVVKIVAKSQKTSCATVRKVLKKLLEARADFIQDLTLNNHLTGIYHSCVKPIMSGEWIAAYEALEATLRTILKDLASYDPVKGALAK